MNFQFHGKDINVTEALKEYATKKLSRLERFFNNLIEVQVTFGVAHNPRIAERYKVEATLVASRTTLRAEEAADSMYAAIDLVADKLERQLKRFKDKLRDRRTASTPLPQPLEMPEGDEEFVPHIVRTKYFVLRPMSPEDAAFHMEELGHNFFVFRNADSNQVSVIYKRRDHNYGLIETQ